MARYIVEDDTTEVVTQHKPSKPMRYTVSEDSAPIEKTANNPLGFGLNSVNKAIAGVADSFLNAPRHLNNLGRASVGAVLTAAGMPDLAPDVTVPNNTIHDLMKNGRMIRDKYDPETPKGRVADYIIQSATGAAISPGSVAKNLTAGVIGGTAGGLTQEATGSPLAGIAASVIAPASLSLAAAAPAAINRNKITDSGVNNMAGDRFIETSGLDKQTVLDRLSQHQDIIPGSQQTSAQALKNGGLAGMQRTYETMPGRIDDSISIPDAFALRYAEQRAAQAGKLNEAMPAQNGAAAFQSAMQNDVDRITGIVGNKADQQTNAIAQNATPEYAGGVARGAIGKNYSQAKAETKAAYAAIDPENTSQVNIPIDDLRAVVDKYYPLAPNDIPPQLQNMIKAAETHGYINKDANELASVPLSTISALRSMAGRYANDAGIDNRTLSAAAGEMKRILSDVPEQAANKGAIPADMADRVRRAVGLRRAQGEKFETGATNNLNRQDSNGSPKLEDAQVMRNFLNGSPDDARRFIAAIGDNKAAMAAAESHIKGEFKAALFSPNGELKKNFSNAYAQFNSQYRPVLDQFPKLKARIDSAMKLQGSAAKTKDALQSGGLRHFLNGKDPDKAVNSLLGSATKQADISDIERAIRNNPDAKGSLAGALKDSLLNKHVQMGAVDALDNQIWSQGNALKTLKDPKNERLLNVLLDAGQKAKLKDFKADLESVQFTKNANRASGSNTGQNLANTAFASAINKVPGNGLVKMLYHAAESIGDDKLKANFAKMLLDPKHAELVIRNMKPTAKSKLSESFTKNLGIYGQTLPHINEAATND